MHKKKGLCRRTHVRHLLNGNDHGVGGHRGTIDKLGRDKRLVILFRISHCALHHNGPLASTRNTQSSLWSTLFGHIAGRLRSARHLLCMQFTHCIVGHKRGFTFSLFN